MFNYRIPEARQKSCIRFLPPKESVLWKDLHKQRSSTRSEMCIYLCISGRRNEPFNYLKSVCFRFDTEEGDSFWTDYTWGMVMELRHSCFFLFGHYLINIILQWRVWSWLRMNASYRLNTCKSRGNDIEACFDGRRPAHGWVTRIQPASD